MEMNNNNKFYSSYFFPQEFEQPGLCESLMLTEIPGGHEASTMGGYSCEEAYFMQQYHQHHHSQQQQRHLMTADLYPCSYEATTLHSEFGQPGQPTMSKMDDFPEPPMTDHCHKLSPAAGAGLQREESSPTSKSQSIGPTLVGEMSPCLVEEGTTATTGAAMTPQNPAAARKRPRTTFSQAQLLELEKEFIHTAYLDRANRISLAGKLSLKEKQIKVWFQNRRMKKKRDDNELKRRKTFPSTTNSESHGIDISCHQLSLGNGSHSNHIDLQHRSYIGYDCIATPKMAPYPGSQYLAASVEDRQLDGNGAYQDPYLGCLHHTTSTSSSSAYPQYSTMPGHYYYSPSFPELPSNTAGSPQLHKMESLMPASSGGGGYQHFSHNVNNNSVS